MKKNKLATNLGIQFAFGFFALLLLCSSQFTWLPMAKIPLAAKMIQTDRMGSLYAISSSNQLTKYEPNGKLIGTLNYAYLGNISSIDASNPLELYLFYREMNSLVFLDNNLAFRGKINLSDVGILQASVASRSYSNGIWVFDQGDLQLKKLVKDGGLSQTSGNVLQFVQNKNLNPNCIFDNGSRVFLNDSAEGILVFDVFATYLKTIPIKGIQSFKVIENDLYYSKENLLVRYNFQTLKSDTIELPEANFKGFSLEQNQIYFLTPDFISIYQFKSP